MSNSDSFIDEVTEEVRRDQLYARFKRYGWIGVALVIAIVGGAAWTEWQRARSATQAEALGDAMLSAIEAEEPQARIDGLATLDATGEAAAVAAMLRAAELDRAGDVAAAAETLDAVAQDGTVDPLYRNLAAFKAILLRGDSLPPEARRAALEGLAVPGVPFRTLALEQIALVDIAAGDIDAALAGLGALVNDAEASEALRDRAQSLIVALGGALPASADAAIAE